MIADLPKHDGLVLGWDDVERPLHGERVIDAKELAAGFWIRLGPVVFRTSYRIIERLASGRYRVGDPKVEYLPEYFMGEPEEKG